MFEVNYRDEKRTFKVWIHKYFVALAVHYEGTTTFIPTWFFINPWKGKCKQCLIIFLIGNTIGGIIAGSLIYFSYFYSPSYGEVLCCPCLTWKTSLWTWITFEKHFKGQLIVLVIMNLMLELRFYQMNNVAGKILGRVRERRTVRTPEVRRWSSQRSGNQVAQPFSQNLFLTLIKKKYKWRVGKPQFIGKQWRIFETKKKSTFEKATRPNPFTNHHRTWFIN